MEGEWLMSSVEGLEDFPLFTDCQKQRILDDLTDKKLKVTTNVKRVEDFIRFNRKWRSVVWNFNKNLVCPILNFDIRYPEIQRKFSIGIEKNTVVDLEEGTSSIFHSFLGSWYVDLTAGEGNGL